ncbi:serine/threonine-protein kinase [Sorangium sp. So ce1128]
MKELDTPVHVGDVLLGKYTVERVLGHGGMGMVVAARHRELGELFAIKLLLPRTLADAQATELLLREARAAVRLKGEHIVRVHDVGTLETGAPYIVMEHLVGGDLQQIIFERGPLPVHEAVDYVLQACDALAEAHAQGLVHRDLKPANLFLTRRPSGAPFVKVLDFGISRRITPDAAELTNSRALLGSPFYMAPEQMVRAKRVDPRSDVWSMGVVLHHLVTGMLPFPGETPGGGICRPEEGQVPCYDHFHTRVTLTSDWKHFKIPVECLTQTGYGIFDAPAQDGLRDIQFNFSAGQAFNSTALPRTFLRRRPV